MQENFLGCVPAILAVALAVVLRLRRSRREASEEIAAEIAALHKKLAPLENPDRRIAAAIAALHKKRAALEYPDRRRAACAVPNWINYQLEQELAQAREGSTTASLRGQKEVDEAFYRLEAIKARMPFEFHRTVDEKYIVEVEAIVELLQQATGMDLNRWLGSLPSEAQPGAVPRVLRIRPCDRAFLRCKILSLQAFCIYCHIHRSQPSRLIH